MSGTKSYFNENYINIGVQKEGKLRNLSLHWLKLCGFSIPCEIEEKKDLLTIRAGSRGANIFNCRIKDIVRNAVDGVLDIGFVSSDTLSLWQSDTGQSLPKVADFLNLDLDYTDTFFTLGFDRQSLAMRNNEFNWQNLVIRSFNEGRPIVTSNKCLLQTKLRKYGLPFNRLKIFQRDGGVEAQGRLMGALVIADLVDKGNTMRRWGYEPLMSLDVSRLLLIGRRPHRPEKRQTLNYIIERLRDEYVMV
jgi:ATP phosphoribosyltransferase